MSRRPALRHLHSGRNEPAPVPHEGAKALAGMKAHAAQRNAHHAALHPAHLRMEPGGRQGAATRSCAHRSLSAETHAGGIAARQPHTRSQRAATRNEKGLGRRRGQLRLGRSRGLQDGSEVQKGGRPTLGGIDARPNPSLVGQIPPNNASAMPHAESTCFLLPSRRERTPRPVIGETRQWKRCDTK